MPDYNTASATMNGNAFSPSSRNNPCPVCGRTKDSDCRIKPNNELVLCHNNFENAATLQPHLWHYDGQTSDGRCGKYILKNDDRTEKPPRSAQTRYFYYPARDGSPLVRVRRIDTTSKKDFSQQRWNGNDFVAGLNGMNRAYIPIYRYAEVQKAIEQGQLIFIVEGETCADLLWSMGLAATTNIGGSGKWRDSDTDDLTGASVVICPDRDQKGIEHAEKLGQHFPKAQWLYCYPNSPKWDDPPEANGLDIENWIADFNLKPESLIKFISPHARRRKDVVYSTTSGSDNRDNGDNDTEIPIVVEKNYVQKAEDALYSDAKWVSIAGQLYRYTGEFYELQPDCLEQRRVAGWLGAYVEKTRYGYAYQRAKARNVNEVFQWIVYRQAVDSRQINLDGLNCSNGVVQIFDDGTHAFKPHNPDLIFTYQGCKYDPKADSSDCDRLLECLEPAQREIFLRTAAAALALKLVRAKIGNIKGLLCYGSGSNGKDTLRTVLAAVLGQGMTSKTLQDFKAYDTGRKFCLAGLEASICNWASENSSAVKLDSIQSLKQFITGDPLEIERKGKDAYSYEPNSIFLGNCNELPTITNGLEAIRRRYAILTFNKTYKRNADPSKGELEADPRLKNDPTFVSEVLAPALLNKMLERIPLLLSQGIDYHATDEAMQTAQEDSRHLWAFAREAGLEFDGSSKTYIGDLYQVLEAWYLDNGWLTLDDSGKKVKKLWEAESPYDPPVKKAQDLYLRLRELYPKIERRIDTQERKKCNYIFGLRLENQVHHVHSLTQSEFHVHRHVHQSDSETGDAIEPKPLPNKDGGHEISSVDMKVDMTVDMESLLNKDGGHEMSAVDMKVDMTVDMEPLLNKDGGHGGHGGHEISLLADFCTLTLPLEMKALSINQPWASLIALGHKRYERRGNQTHYRGKIAIHATAEKRSHEETLGILALQEDGLLPEEIPFSAVIAIAEITDCIPATQEFIAQDFTELDKKVSGSAPGGYLWKLENIQAFKPIPAKGQLGLWNWTPPESVSSTNSDTESLYEQWESGQQFFLKVGTGFEAIAFEEFKYDPDGNLLAVVRSGDSQKIVPASELLTSIPATNVWEEILSLEYDRDGYKASFYPPGKLPNWEKSFLSLVAATNDRLWAGSEFIFLVPLGAEKSFESPRDWWVWRRDFCEKDWENWGINKTVLRVTAVTGRSGKNLIGSTGYFKGMRLNGKKPSKVLIGIIDPKSKEVKVVPLELWQVQKA